MKHRGPIFYDAERVRWRLTSRILEVSGALLTLLLAYFFITVAVPVYLPAVLQQAGRPVYRAVPVKKGKIAPPREGRKRRVAELGRVPDSYDPLRAAFFVSWDSTSLASLKKHYKDLDLLIPEQLHAVTPDGALTVVDYERYQTLQVAPEAALALLQGDKLHQWMKQQKVADPKFELPIMGLVNNYDGQVWREKELAAMLADPAARRRLIEQLAQYAVRAREAGLVLDFEEVPDASQRHFREFVAELGPALHAVGLKLMVCLPARDSVYDYGFIGKQCDAIVLMNYDQHWLTSPPGPIAAQDWFMENLRQVREVVPPAKIVMGIANYAYDWAVGPAGKSEPANNFSVQEALLHAFESESEMEFDEDSLNPHYSYYDEHNHVHQVWLLDAVTAYNQLRASERQGVQGTALWRLGTADTSIWPIWDATRPDDAMRSKLEDVAPGPDLILEGDGDIWRIADTPKHGKRSIHYDASTDLITSESYEAYPLSYDIERSGAVPHKIVLSFDDGPDPRWTPKILDILREKKAPATFFSIGEEINRSPGLLRREYAEGHEIGNHTYFHPKMDEITHAQLRFELNLTQRLIESTIGVKSTLFRPPYGIDHQPEYAEEVAAFPIPQEMGYLLVGSRIDPQDWKLLDGKTPLPAAEIVNSVLLQANKGNIILFHDGGGDRSQTVAALPEVIDKLRTQGYQFVTVADLLGKTRAQVMLPLTPRERLEARADGFIFAIDHWLRLVMATLFVAGIILVSGRALVVGILALIEKVRPDRVVLQSPPPSVTVLIPAHNEEDVILDTVGAVLRSDLPGLKVIVVNDGSADRTGELLDAHFGASPRVTILHQVNRGKAVALSRAMAEANTEIFVTIDADTEVEPDAVSKLVRHFAHPDVGAVAGNVKVGNRTRWLTRWQALEYITSQNLEKRAFDLLNCITVVPGALGAWRKAAIEAAGGITSDTVAEDADLTIAIRKHGWRICYDEEAIAWTEAPDTPAALVRQRFRWTFGTLQSCWKHRDMLFRWKHGTLGWIALPNIFIFQLLFPLISPVIDLMFLYSVLAWGLSRLNLFGFTQVGTTANLERSALFFFGFLLIDVLTCVIAFLLEKKEDWTLLVPVLLQRFYYRQLMYVVLFRSVKEAVSGRPVGWRGVEKEAPREIAHA
jgi:cellulose synthase/poly-beta-1,6-N-acetylglucosamine synthase-like glycosyltransferase/peptidoglycan/xylan/chitin deacetylase (PgdA/CDA1 family)/spore germination protein YaaH